MYLLILAVLAIFLYFCWQTLTILYQRHVVWRHFEGPPVDSTYKGHLSTLQRAQKQNRWLDLMQKFVQIYGKTFLLWRFTHPIIFTTDPDVLESVWNNFNLEKIPTLPNRSFFESTITGTESFLSTAGGLNWALKRKILTHFFSKANQVQLFEGVKSLVDKSVGEIRGRVESGQMETFNMDVEFATMSEALMVGYGLDSLSDMFQSEAKYLGENVVHLIEEIPLPHKLSTKAKIIYKSSESAVKVTTFIEYVRKEIREAYLQLEKGYRIAQHDAEYKAKLKLVGLLIDANQQTSAVKRIDNFVNDIMTLIIVVDNIAKALTIALAKVIRDGEVYRKLTEEIRQTKVESFDDLNSLKYTEMVILETMRWSPILQRGARQLESFFRKENIQLGKYSIPNGSTTINIQWSQYIMHHDEEFWENPELFDPERFRNGTKGMRRNTFIPFIAGPRACLGKHLAMMQLKLMIHSMITNFDMGILETEERLVLDRKYTIVKVKQGQNVMLTAV